MSRLHNPGPGEILDRLTILGLKCTYDNHHSALMCPYCNPDHHVLIHPRTIAERDEALARLEQEMRDAATYSRDEPNLMVRWADTLRALTDAKR